MKMKTDAAAIKQIKKICLQCGYEFGTDDLWDDDYCSDSCWDHSLDSDDDESGEY
jgi:hypothetical protein